MLLRSKEIPDCALKVEGGYILQLRKFCATVSIKILPTALPPRKAEGEVFTVGKRASESPS